MCSNRLGSEQLSLERQSFSNACAIHSADFDYLSMEHEDSYDYSTSLPFITEFINPFGGMPFIEEMEENYGKLWQFKDCVQGWTLGVSRFKNYVYLLHCESSKGSFLPLNLDEKVTLLENFYQEYVVITLQAVDARGEDTPHIHSNVAKIGEVNSIGVPAFDINGLLDTLAGTSMEELRPELESKYVPWTYTSAESSFRKISSIYRTMSRYIAQGGPNVPAIVNRIAPQNTAEGRDASQSRTQGSRSQANTNVPARLKCNTESSSQAGPSIKRRKSTPGAGSLGSGLTHVDRRAGKSAEPIPNYEKFAKVQIEFWKECEGCYIFGQQTFQVDIAQCVPARDEYVIRKLQPEIVKSVKAELVQLGDEKMRQKVCLIPIDRDSKLLREKPNSWDEIKAGKFMIINGQHSITASKELQISGCGDKCRVELSKWEAYIVWSLDPVKLTNISKFYNSTNHLEHAQPTWGWQLISGRNIWIPHGRPTDKDGEHERRRNHVVLNQSKYTVSFYSNVHIPSHYILPRSASVLEIGRQGIEAQVSFLT